MSKSYHNKFLLFSVRQSTQCYRYQAKQTSQIFSKTRSKQRLTIIEPKVANNKPKVTSNQQNVTSSMHQAKRFTSASLQKRELNFNLRFTILDEIPNIMRSIKPFQVNSSFYSTVLNVQYWIQLQGKRKEKTFEKNF